MRLRQTSKTLCAFILLGALMMVSAPTLSGQPLGGSPAGLDVSDSASHPSILSWFLDWMSEWTSDGSAEDLASEEPGILDANGGSGASTEGDGDDDGDTGSGLDPIG